MSKHTLFVVPGTWEVPSGVSYDTPIGMLAPYAHRVNRNVFDVRFVNYPATFGPIPNDRFPNEWLGAPSFAESRDQGIAELKRLINETPGTFGLVGFSQGGAIVDLVVRALVEGDMQHRLRDCRWAHAFASPHRAKGKTFHLDDPNRLQFEGIADDPVENTGTIDYFAYAIADDIFTNCDIDRTYGDEVYDAVKTWSLQDPAGIISMASGISGLLSLIGESLGSSGGSSAPIADPDLLTLLRTAAAAKRHQDTAAHDGYKNPAHSYFGGMTAIDHSLNHLNYWGERI